MTSKTFNPYRGSRQGQLGPPGTAPLDQGVLPERVSRKIREKLQHKMNKYVPNPPVSSPIFHEKNLNLNYAIKRLKKLKKDQKLDSEALSVANELLKAMGVLQLGLEFLSPNISPKWEIILEGYRGGRLRTEYKGHFFDLSLIHGNKTLMIYELDSVIEIVKTWKRYPTSTVAAAMGIVALIDTLHSPFSLESILTETRLEAEMHDQIFEAWPPVLRYP